MTEAEGQQLGVDRCVLCCSCCPASIPGTIPAPRPLARVPYRTRQSYSHSVRVCVCVYSEVIDSFLIDWRVS